MNISSFSCEERLVLFSSYGPYDGNRSDGGCAALKAVEPACVAVGCIDKRSARSVEKIEQLERSCLIALASVEVSA